MVCDGYNFRHGYSVGVSRGGKGVAVKNLAKAPILTEHQEACRFSAWLDAHGYTSTHIANERKSSAVGIAKLKKEGMKKGFPDYLIMLFYLQKGELKQCMVFIELKSLKGRATIEQKQWISKLDKPENSAAAVCYGAEDAIRFLKICEEKFKELR